MAPVFNQALKAGYVGFVTDIYIYIYIYIHNVYKQQSITKGAPSECQQHWPEYEGRDLQ